jgi:CheY-like chemotaxis protein
MQAILIVDDDCETRDALAGLLTDEGYVVRVASDGADALEQLRAGYVGLVLTDLLMPRMSGWTLLEIMASEGDLAAIPAVVITALSRDRLPGGVVALRKPFAIDALFDVVERALRRTSVSGLCAAPMWIDTESESAVRTRFPQSRSALAKCGGSMLEAGALPSYAYAHRHH